MSTLVAVLVMMIVALISGILLAYARLRWEVEAEVDPVLEKINGLLPQTQCGQCGYPGCRPYAKAILSGDEINKCPPGGEQTILLLAQTLGREKTGLAKAEAAPGHTVIIREKDCIGCRICIQACPVDAILGAARFTHTVIQTLCTGCDLCIEPCPVDCIEIIVPELTIQHWQWPEPLLP